MLICPPSKAKGQRWRHRTRAGASDARRLRQGRTGPTTQQRHRQRRQTGWTEPTTAQQRAEWTEAATELNDRSDVMYFPFRQAHQRGGTWFMTTSLRLRMFSWCGMRPHTADRRQHRPRPGWAGPTTRVRQSSGATAAALPALPREAGRTGPTTQRRQSRHQPSSNQPQAAESAREQRSRGDRYRAAGGVDRAYHTAAVVEQRASIPSSPSTSVAGGANRAGHTSAAEQR